MAAILIVVQLRPSPHCPFRGGVPFSEQVGGTPNLFASVCEHTDFFFAET